jgi:hypothetical protein
MKNFNEYKNDRLKFLEDEQRIIIKINNYCLNNIQKNYNNYDIKNWSNIVIGLDTYQDNIIKMYNAIIYFNELELLIKLMNDSININNCLDNIEKLYNDIINLDLCEEIDKNLFLDILEEIKNELINIQGGDK